MHRLGAMALTAVALLTHIGACAGDEWPSRPVKIVVAFGAGGSADQLGRLLAAELSNALKQQFFVENRAGNSGAIGSAQVARAAPDGYTLLIGGSGPHLTGPAINPNIGYDPLKDFTHIAMIAADSYAWAANPALGARSIDDLIRLARSRTTPLTSSSPGPGSLGHLLIEQFKRKAGIDIQHVPAPNSGLTDVLGNHIALSLTAMMTVGEQVKAGQLVAIAVTSTERNPVFAAIPTFAEQGYPDVRGATWFWLCGPKGLPADVVTKLSDTTRHVVGSAKVREHFQKLALLTKDLDPAAVQRFIAEEYAFWAPLARSAGLKVQ
ncbi:MAG: tripartite tricarboxylate transporter substrate binding protein [Hyphomicrobiales bacterium]|nr:tripartite tricarboxylate transporter substrate binding protein [Hyphomicrobiales bacterium]